MGWKQRWFCGDGGKTPAYGAGGASTWGGASAWVAGQEEALLGVVLKVQVPFGIEVKVEVQLQVATKVATPPDRNKEETPPGIEVRGSSSWESGSTWEGGNNTTWGK